MERHIRAKIAQVKVGPGIPVNICCKSRNSVSVHCVFFLFRTWRIWEGCRAPVGRSNHTLHHKLNFGCRFRNCFESVSVRLYREDMKKHKQQEQQRLRKSQKGTTKSKKLYKVATQLIAFPNTYKAYHKTF